MAGSELKADVWVNEYITPWDIYSHGITQTFAYKKTQYQEMYIVETGAYGKALVLDGKWQSCTGDEFLYHEPMVHPAMVAHGNPKKVLILGGGEGATLREVLRWNTVERAVMIDIDGDVVEACREHLPEMHQGAFDDPRTELVIGDALEFVDTTNELWDVILYDLSDPIEEGPSFPLFTQELFQKVRRILAPDGYLAVQSGPVSPAELLLHARLANTLKTVFTHAQSYSSYVPTYAAPWSFILTSSNPINTNPNPEEIDRILKENTKGGLQMFDGITLVGMMHLPANLRRAIANETQVYTLKEPPKFFGKGVAQ
jgi:spermidine synthase